MQCPRCSHENPPDARFCNACGTSLEAGASPPVVSAETSHTDFLQRYIPQALADKMRQLGGQVESERRHVTVVFADISGFTAMSEKLDPEEVTHIINACFKTLVEVIFKYEGTIDKFIGDEIMALFGAPIAHENDPERAIRAALEMQARLREFNANLKTPLPKPLAMHVGINSGEVIAGNVGSDLRMDYSVLGDTVNLAARLESVSVSGQILVSERTYALTRHLFEFKRLKPFKVQGKQKKVQTYEVLGVKAVPERGRGVSERYGPLVGRGEELAQLRGLVEQVQQGQGRVVGVVGEAGIGKSRLVYELQGMAAEFTSSSGACISYEVPASYQVFTDVMRSLLPLAPDDPEEVLRRKLEAWVVAHGIDRAVHFPFLGSLFGLRDEKLLYLSDEARLQGVKEALLAVFRALTAECPLLLIFEDLHWIDSLSRRLLEELVPEVGALPLLLCCVYRPEFQPPWKDYPYCQLLPVGPLSPEQTVELSQTLLDLDLPPHLEQLIISRAEGNPFFAEELLKALIDARAILKTRTGYTLQQDLSQLRLPDTMQGVILARLDRLEVQARDTLQYASVIGRRFFQALLQTVSPRSQHVEQDLQYLQTLELVYQHIILPELEYIFKHFVIREVAYNNILARRRKAIHLETAKAIEKLYRGRLEEYYEVLAHHFEAGEDWQKAVDYYGRAGSKARELHTEIGASAFLDRREQAVHKVFEQVQGKPLMSRLQIGLGIYQLLLCLLLLSLAFFYSPFPSPWHWSFGFMVFSILGFIVLLIQLIRAPVADVVTIYTDHLLIRTSKEAIQVVFSSIESIRYGRPLELTPTSLKKQWERQKRGLRSRRTGAKSRVVYGTSRLGTGWWSLYSGAVKYYLDIFVKGQGCISIHTTQAGHLYGELKLAMTRWAAKVGVDLTGILESEFSRFEDQYHLILQSSAGTSPLAVTYDRLIEKIEKGDVGSLDAVGIREGVAEPVWISLAQASQEDRNILAALYPMRCTLKVFKRLWLSLFVGVGIVVGLIFLLFPTPLGMTTPQLAVVVAGTVIFMGVSCSFLLLRFGILQWAKRLTLSSRQWVALRVVTGILAAVVVGGGFYVGISFLETVGG